MRIVKSAGAGGSTNGLATFDANGNLVFTGSTASASNLFWIGRTASANRMEINNGVGGGEFDFTFNGGRGIGITQNGIINYRNIATAGIGTVPVYAAGVQTLYTNVAPTSLSYTPPATAGVYRLSGYLDVLTATALTFKVIISYREPGGSTVTDIPAFYLQNTTALLAGGPAANTAGRYVMMPYTFAINNGAVAISIADNVGTYTTCTYYWTPVLEQLA